MGRVRSKKFVKPAAAIFSAAALISSCGTGERAVLGERQPSATTTTSIEPQRPKFHESGIRDDSKNLDNKLTPFETTINAYGRRIIVNCVSRPIEIAPGDSLFTRTVAVNTATRNAASRMTSPIFLATEAVNKERGMVNTNDLKPGNPVIVLEQCATSEIFDRDIDQNIETPTGVMTLSYDIARNYLGCKPVELCAQANIATSVGR